MDFWNDLQIIANYLDQISAPAILQVAEESGFPDNTWRGWLVPAYFLSPEPLTASALRFRSPYTNPTRLSQMLIGQCLQGSLEERGDGFILSSHARKTIQKMIAAGQGALTDRINFPVAVLEQMVRLFKPILSTALTSAEPHAKWCITHNHDQVQMDSQPPIVQLEQICSDFKAWRDDCHLGAWQPYHYIQGYVWEVFSLVWRNGGQGLDDICRKLCDLRGYTPHDYAAAIDELKLRGWLFEEGGHFFLTSSGATIRNLAEDYTDELFDAPFFALSETELSLLKHLIEDLMEALRRLCAS
jgi:hypothetical protein